MRSRCRFLACTLSAVATESGSRPRIWRIVWVIGAIIAVVCAVVAIVVGMATGRTLAGTPDDLVPVEAADELLTGMEAGRTFYLYAPEDTDIVNVHEAEDAIGCEFDGPDLYVNDNPRFYAPIDVEGVVHEPVLTIMNGSSQGASYTVACETDDLLIGTASSSKEFHVHGAFWPAVVVGGLGLAAAIVGSIVLAVRSRTLEG